jgi:hypothetical protein
MLNLVGLPSGLGITAGLGTLEVDPEAQIALNRLGLAGQLDLCIAGDCIGLWEHKANRAQSVISIKSRRQIARLYTCIKSCESTSLLDSFPMFHSSIMQRGNTAKNAAIV